MKRTQHVPTRRDFLRSSGAFGSFVVLGGGSTLLAGCHGGVHELPEEIDNTGTTNVSALLNDVLAATAPGDVVKFRRQPGGSPGRYWIPQGIKVSQDGTTLDLNGCHLFTGTILGLEDPDLATNITAYPCEWDDFGPSVATTWPRERCNVLIAASDVKIMSSEPGARIQGAARRVQYRSPWSGNRAWSSGCGAPGFAGVFEMQACVRIGGRPGAYSTTNHYSSIELDLTNISLEFPHGDGVYLGDNHSNIWIHGQQLGANILSGAVFDSSSIVGVDGQGADIDPISTSIPYDEDLWVPWAASLPGIHHTGRQGIATDYRTSDVLIEGLAIWRTAHAAIDLEPAATLSDQVNVTVRGAEVGIHHGLFLACAGRTGSIDNLVVEDTVHYELPTISTTSSGTYPSGYQHSNWRIENNVVASGVRAKMASRVWTLNRVDGVQILGNHIPVRPGWVGPNFDDSVIGAPNPALSAQFPETPP